MLEGQALLVVSGRNLSEIAERLPAQLEQYADARIVSMVIDNARVTSFRGGITVLVVVDHA
jgi:hypothetical protein